MNLSVILSALTEAWQEVKIQKARVILSLVGVVAAVAAMSTVIALGEIMTQSFQEEMEAMSGRDTTITLRITEKSAGEDDYAYDAMMGGPGGVTVYYDDGQEGSGTSTANTASDLTNAPLSDEVLANFEKAGWNANDVKPSVFSRATQILASRFSLSHYSRVATSTVSIPEVNKALSDGQYKGRPVTPEGYAADMVGTETEGDVMAMDTYIETRAVDTDYKTLYRLRMESGRWLSSGDVNQRVTPVVINSIFWSYLADTPLNEGITLSLNKDTQVRVVGVVQSRSPWEMPIIYMPYDSWELAGDMPESEYADNSLLVWVDPSQGDEARKVLPQTLGSLLGDKYTVSAESGMDSVMYMGNEEDGSQTIILAIGAIVILLGILGLVNVAIVTVRQRIREIGIRRAVGASAKRVFFAVFLESVVATFIAGLIGVMLSILIVRNLPLERLDIYLQDPPGFPMSTAITALLIATGIGALAGIIPAVTALKVKPIDAIRY